MFVLRKKCEIEKHYGANKTKGSFCSRVIKYLWISNTEHIHIIKMETALVFGGTGLVGKCLIKELIANENYNQVIIFSRRETGLSDPKLKECLIDFNNLEQHKDLLKGDHLYICLGTTLKNAGSVAKVRVVDYEYPIEIARIAFNNGIKSIALVSSIGANLKSRSYYTKIKGEVERDIEQLGFNNLVIVRPSLLLGKREEKRFGEGIAKVIMKGIGFLMVGKLKKYKGIDACVVARAMMRLLLKQPSEKIFESDVLQDIGK